MLLQSHNVLDLFSGIIIPEPEQKNPEIVSLVGLLNNLKESTGEDAGNVPVEMKEAMDQEVSALLEKLCKHPIVQDAWGSTLNFLESLSRKVELDKQCLENAMCNYILGMQGTIRPHSFNIGQFYKDIRIFAENYNTQKHVLDDICNSPDLPSEEKEKAISALLEEIVQEEELTDVVEDIANILKRPVQQASQEAGQEQTASPPIQPEESHTSPFMTIKERLERQEGRYPCLEDIESGSYYRKECYHQEVADILRKNNRCLIVATPGCGKTSLAIVLGYEFLQKGISVYYHDAATDSDTDKWEEFIQSCDENTLVILDNAHTRITEINNLICRKYNAMLLINSRKVPDSVTFTRPPTNTYDISYLDIFQREKAIVEFQISGEIIRHIIRQHVGNKKDDSKNIGSIDLIIKKSAGDYNIFHFYIQAWENKGYSEILSDIKEEDVLIYVYNHYLRDCPYQQELLKISVLTQLEIGADLTWFSKDEKFKDKGRLIQKDGLVLISKEEPFTNAHVFWLLIYHPTAAEYFLKAASLSFDCHYIHDVDEFSLTCLKDYLRAGPFNFFRLFQVLYEHKKNWHEKLMKTPTLISFEKSVQ